LSYSSTCRQLDLLDLIVRLQRPGARSSAPRCVNLRLAAQFSCSAEVEGCAAPSAPAHLRHVAATMAASIDRIECSASSYVNTKPSKPAVVVSVSTADRRGGYFWWPSRPPFLGAVTVSDGPVSRLHAWSRRSSKVGARRWTAFLNASRCRDKLLTNVIVLLSMRDK